MKEEEVSKGTEKTTSGHGLLKQADFSALGVTGDSS